MTSIQSLAVEPASIETPKWRSSRYKHSVNGFIVDGDYLLIKVNKVTALRTEEYVWNNVVPTLNIQVGEGIPTLINPNNPFYTWTRRPEQWQPCWLRWQELELLVIDMATGETIGHGIPYQDVSLSFSCRDRLPDVDEWMVFRELSASLFADLGYDVVNLRLPEKSEILREAARCSYWAPEAHGDSYCFEMIYGGERVYATEIRNVIANRVPYTFSVLGHCNALDETGLDTWAQVLTRDLPGHIVVGWTHVERNLGAWEMSLVWKTIFYNYIRSGYSIPDAFEESIASVPEIASIVAMYEGLEKVEIAGVVYIWWENIPDWIPILSTGNIWPADTELHIGYFIENNNEFDVNVATEMFGGTDRFVLPSNGQSSVRFTIPGLNPGFQTTNVVIAATRKRNA